MNIVDLVRKYVTLRDKKQAMEAEHKQQVARLNTALRKIEGMFMDEMNETGVESLKTAAGTAYRSVRTSAKVEDRDMFLHFVRNSDAWDFLESRANKTAVEAYLNEHGELPPGITVTRAATINFRKS